MSLEASEVCKSRFTGALELFSSHLSCTSPNGLILVTQKESRSVILTIQLIHPNVHHSPTYPPEYPCLSLRSVFGAQYLVTVLQCSPSWHSLLHSFRNWAHARPVSLGRLTGASALSLCLSQQHHASCFPCNGLTLPSRAKCPVSARATAQMIQLSTLLAANFLSGLVLGPFSLT